MSDLRRRMTGWQWVATVILAVSALGLIGGFIWSYPTWPFSVLLVIAMIVNIVNVVGTRSNVRNAQENDPNRR